MFDHRKLKTAEQKRAPDDGCAQSSGVCFLKVGTSSKVDFIVWSKGWKCAGIFVIYESHSPSTPTPTVNRV
jgi:hypothetical protein